MTVNKRKNFFFFLQTSSILLMAHSPHISIFLEPNPWIVFFSLCVVQSPMSSLSSPFLSTSISSQAYLRCFTWKPLCSASWVTVGSPLTFFSTLIKQQRSLCAMHWNWYQVLELVPNGAVSQTAYLTTVMSCTILMYLSATHILI